MISTHTRRNRGTIGLIAVALLVSALLVAIPSESQAGVLKCDGKTVTITGTAGDDVINGTANADVIHGLGGNDTINGKGAGDTICGGGGDDVLRGGAGNDKIFGGDGNDTLKGEGNADTLKGGAGDDILQGGDGADSLDGGADADTLKGDKKDDTLIGGAGPDYLAGGEGSDLLEGGDGNDRLTGQNGNDTLKGQKGVDTLVGNAGTDTANGGNGNDRCAANTEAACEANPYDFEFERFLINQAVPQADSSQPANQRVGTVEERAGIVRVFVSGNQPNVPSPVVRLHWRVNGVTGKAKMTGPATLPQNPQESNLSSTFNYEFDETLLKPGADMYVTIDPADKTLETNENNNRYPAKNWRDLDTKDVPKMKITVVPITIQGGPAANISLSQAKALLAKTLKVHPIGDYNIQVRENYVFENPTGTTQDWITLVNEMMALQLAENPARQYHAFLPQGLSPGIAGIGFIGFPAAVSIQNQETIAHETGHNLNLPHATCSGQEGNPDPNYPYPGGVIGSWGYDVASGTLYDPDVFVDLMTYCAPEWISDYNFNNVLNYRSGPFGWETDVEAFAPAGEGVVLQFQGMVPSSSSQQLSQDNAVGNTAQALISSVQVVNRQALPPAFGDHRLVGVDATGKAVLSVPFQSYALDHADGAAFAFSIELTDAALLRVASWNVEKAGQVLTTRAAG